ncbi:MAG: HAD-IA family hydrolase [Lachnospiraceae bacterium]|nr:HAD-IA family hydrolase [Lachnospiraceae bacterium]
MTQGKSHHDIFLKACEKLGKVPKNCLVREDNEAGIEVAYRVGISVICIPDIK